MKMNSEMLLKVVSIVFTALLHLPVSLAFRGIPFSGLEKLMLAKRGETPDWGVTFKGKPFLETTVVRKHEDVVLECEAGGSPTPTIHWLKDGVRIQQGDHPDRYSDDSAFYEETVNEHSSLPLLRLGKVKSKLFLDCANNHHKGEYTCVAETTKHVNDAISEKFSISQTTKLEVVSAKTFPEQSGENCVTKKAFRGEPARIHLWTAVRVEYTGAAVQLFCRAEGRPEPTLSWRYSELGDKIEDDENHTILPNGDLLIKDINFMENMGDYYCTAENEAGIDEVSTFLYPTS